MVSPYKDPAELHLMKKILDKIITGFFVFNFGVLWYLSTRYYVRPNQFNIVIYDPFGKEFKMDGIRTKFNTKNAAVSYTKEYRKRFPNYDFTIGESISEITRRTIFSLPRIQR